MADQVASATNRTLLLTPVVLLLVSDALGIMISLVSNVGGQGKVSWKIVLLKTYLLLPLLITFPP